MRPQDVPQDYKNGVCDKARGMAITLNGVAAHLCGGDEFATVWQEKTLLTRSFAWETAQHILENGGAFKSF